jgi:hypothetical protein
MHKLSPNREQTVTQFVILKIGLFHTGYIGAVRQGADALSANGEHQLSNADPDMPSLQQGLRKGMFFPVQNQAL